MNRTVQLAHRVAVALGLLFAASLTNADEPKKGADVVKVVVAADMPDADGKQTVTITLTPQKPWRILANPVGNKELVAGQTVVTMGGKGKPEVVKIDYPRGTLIKDKDIGDLRVYEDKVEIKAHVRRVKGDTEKLEVSVYFVPENSKEGICLFPAIVKATVP
jgi:hypothetical protein